MLVVQGSGPCLLGRDRLAAIRFDWRCICEMTLHVSATMDERVQQLQQHYPEVFAKELGTITPYLAKLKVKPNAAPKAAPSPLCSA